MPCRDRDDIVPLSIHNTYICTFIQVNFAQFKAILID